MYPDENPKSEDYARLRGLMSQLALPALTIKGGAAKKRTFEVEVLPDTWMLIDSIIIESDRLIFKIAGVEPARFYEFLRVEGVPRWREAFYL